MQMKRPKSGSNFVGQKINHFSPISQYSNHVFENEEQLLSIDIEHRRQLVIVVKFKTKPLTCAL